MGKRKKAAKAPTKKKSEPLATTFACLFCNHEHSVTVKLDRKAGVGQLSCKVCGQSFQCAVNYLSAPVDVYAEWVDACDSVSKEKDAENGGEYTLSSGTVLDRRAARSRGADVDIDDDQDGYEGEGIVADDEEY